MDCGIMFEMSLLMGLLLGGFIAMVIGALVIGIAVLYRSAMGKIEKMVKDMEKWGEEFLNDEE